MNVVAIIQARTGSTRLPGKVLMPLDEQCVLDWVIARVKRFPFIHRVVVATTEHEADDPVVALAKAHGVLAVRDNLTLRDGRNDVMARFHKAIRLTQADHVVRITADCPFISPQLAAEVWHRYDYRYAANVTPTLDGFDVEIFSAQAFGIHCDMATHPDDRHHVTLAFRRTPFVYVAQPQVHGRKLSIDTRDDYLLAHEIAERVGIEAEWPTIIAAADEILGQPISESPA